MRTVFSATLGAFVLSAVISATPANAGQPLRVIPAVRQVEQGNQNDEVTQTGWRHGHYRVGRYHGGFYGGYRHIGHYHGGGYRGFGHLHHGHYRGWGAFGYRPHVYSAPYYAGYAPRPYYTTYRPAYVAPVYSTYAPAYPVYAAPAYPSYAPTYPAYTTVAPAPVYAPRTYYRPSVYSGYCGGGYYWGAWR